ncbi:MAG: acyl carrier protein [Lachnospiraceae bacterium]|nr:acyl carrier protein [Lachnospiraceae bacterium]
MEELKNILEMMHPGVDYDTCTTLIDDHIFGSFDVINLVSDLEDAFDVEFSPVDIVPENFNSMQTLWQTILRLQDGE